MRVVRYRTDEGAAAFGVLEREVVHEALGEAPTALRPGAPVAGLGETDPVVISTRLGNAKSQGDG